MKRISLVLLLLLVGVGYPQSTVQKLQQAVKKAGALEIQKTQQAARLKTVLTQLDTKGKQLVHQLTSLEQRVTGLERGKHNTEQQIIGLEQQVETTRKQVTAEQTNLKALSVRMRSLELDLYTERAGRYLPLLRSDSFMNFLIKGKWIGYLGRSDVQLVEQINTTLTRLNNAETHLLRLVKSLNQAQAQRERQIQALTTSRKQLDTTLAEIKRQKAFRQILLEQTLAAASRLDREVTQLQQKLLTEQRRLAAERRRTREAKKRVTFIHKNAPLPKALVGQLILPIPGGKVSASYGSSSSLDFEEIIAPKAASPVLAAAGGRVFATLPYSTFGWMVMIQHSSSLFTQYINLQQPLVKQGQTVKQGQVIGYLGGGALYPPDMLPFRVAIWQNSAFHYVDPASYY